MSASFAAALRVIDAQRALDAATEERGDKEDAEASRMFGSTMHADGDAANAGDAPVEDPVAAERAALTEAATGLRTALPAAEAPALAWSLRFAAALGALPEKTTAADAVVAVGAALKSGEPAEVPKDAQEVQQQNQPAASSSTTAWSSYSSAIIRDLDLASATALARDARCMNSAAMGDALQKRNRRLAMLSRTLLCFAPPAPASRAAWEISAALVASFGPSSNPKPQTVWAAHSEAARIADLAAGFGLHPLRVVHALLDVMRQLPCFDFSRAAQARLALAKELLLRLAGSVECVARTLLTQALSERFARLRAFVAPALQPRTSGAGGSGTVAAREVAGAASAALNGEVQLLARLVRGGVLTAADAWSLCASDDTLGHVDFSKGWFAAVAQYTEEMRAHGSAAATDIILNPKELKPETLGTSQVIGNNFALLVFPRPRPTWGLLFPTTAGAVVPKLTPVSLAVALIRSGCVAQALGLVAELRKSGVDLALCPNTATPHGGLGSTLADFVVNTFASGSSSNSAATTADAARLWLDVYPALVASRRAWACLPAMTAIVQWLTTALTAALTATVTEADQQLQAAGDNDDDDHDDGDDEDQEAVANDDAAAASFPTPADAIKQPRAFWIARCAAFLKAVAFPTLPLLSPSPALGAALARLMSLLPFAVQRGVVLALEPRMLADTLPADEAADATAVELIENLRQRTLLNHCLNRIASGEPRAFAGLLAPVFHGNPILVASRLLAKAVGYSTEDLWTTNALLVRDASPLFYSVLQVLALERARQAALRDDASAPARINAIATYFGLVWRHNWAAVNGRYVLAFLNRELARQSRAGVLLAVTFLRQLWRCLVHSPLEHAEQYDTAQEAALACGSLGRWFAGPRGQAFLSTRWQRGVFTPKMLRANERSMHELLRACEPRVADDYSRGARVGGAAAELGDAFGACLLRGLLKLHTNVVELYSDLPGLTDDILALQQQETDNTGDLALAVFASAFATMHAEKRPTVLQFAKLAAVANGGIAALLSNERAAWRSACLRPRSQKSATAIPSGGHSPEVAGAPTAPPADDMPAPLSLSNQPTPGESAPAPAAATESSTKAAPSVDGLAALADLLGGLPALVGAVAPQASNDDEDAVKDSSSNVSAAHQLTKLFWLLQLSDVAPQAAHERGYELALARAKEFSEKGELHAKRNAADRVTDDFGSARKEYEDERQSIQRERDVVAAERTGAAALLRDFVTGSLLGASNVTEVLPDPRAWAHACAVRRARVSVADALYAPAFLGRLFEHVASTTSANAAALRAWIVEVLSAVATNAVTFFVGLTPGEAARLFVCLRDSLALVNTIIAAVPTAQAAPLQRRRLELEAYLAQPVAQLLASDDVPALVHRHTFLLLDKLKSVFPGYAASNALVAAAAKLHAVPSSPWYASASSIAHAQAAKAAAAEDALVTACAVHPFGDDGCLLDGDMRLAHEDTLTELLADALAATEARAQALAADGAADQQQPAAKEEEASDDDDGEDEEGESDAEAANAEDEAEPAAADEFVAVATVQPTASGAAGQTAESEDDEAGQQEATAADLAASAMAAVERAVAAEKAKQAAGASASEAPAKKSRAEGEAAEGFDE